MLTLLQRSQCLSRPQPLGLGLSGRRLVSSKTPIMPQVEVDDPKVQENLGRMQMEFIRKAEKSNLERAEKHRKQRKLISRSGIGLIVVIASIYLYSMVAIKQVILKTSSILSWTLNQEVLFRKPFWMTLSSLSPQ